MNNNQNTYLTIHEIFSLASREIKERFASFFLLAGIGVGIYWLLTGLCFGFNPLVRPDIQETNPVLVFAVSIVSMFLGAWTTSAFVLYICKRTESIKEALLLGLSRVLRLIGGALILLLGLTIVSGVLLLLMLLWIFLMQNMPVLGMLGSIFFMMLIFAVCLVAVIYCIFLPYKLILTDDPISKCFSGSFALVKGNFWWTCGYLLVLTLILFAINTLGGIVLGVFLLLFSLILPAAVGIISFLWVPLLAFMAMVFQVPTVALYLDRNTVEANIQEHNPSLEQGREQ